MADDKTDLNKGYALIPMHEITDEARKLAVVWCDNYEPMGIINLESKHELASDIMRYANKEFERRINLISKEVIEKELVGYINTKSKFKQAYQRGFMYAVKWLLEKLKTYKYNGGK